MIEAEAEPSADVLVQTAEGALSINAPFEYVHYIHM
jgi:hypothetical protein